MQFHSLKIEPEDGPVLTGWCTKQGHKSVLFFAHGNGFCGRVYQPVLELLAQKYDLLMFDIPGHGRTPEADFSGWNKTAEHLWYGIQSAGEVIKNRDLHAVGHSLGGMLSILMASERPETFKSMVLLDPIIFPQPLLFFLHIVRKSGLTGVFHPYVKSTLRRRNSWADRREAFRYFHKRKIFKDWTDQSLESYVQHALVEKDMQVQLCCDPKLEAQWFSSLPDELWPSVKGLAVPVSIYMGNDTYPFSLRAGRQAKRINTAIDFNIVPGGHCFMQEHPSDAADYVFKALEKQKARAGSEY